MVSKSKNPIGIFDSGIGGRTVLNDAVRELPNEDFVYLSDSKNFPYGDKEYGELKAIIIKNIGALVDQGCKAVIVACNTATGIAIDDLREAFPIPIIGMEPAIKPALEGEHQKILVLATPVTLELEKFNQLRTKLDKNEDIVVLPAKGLAGLIEESVLKGVDKKKIEDYLEELFGRIEKEEFSTVVLGCTHYVFIKELIQKLFPGREVIDGNMGAVNRLKQILEDSNLLNKQKEKGKLCQINTK